MISMDVNHPDIEEFVTIKSDVNKVTKANISVKITDKFMYAVKNNDLFELYFKREETGEEISKTVDAKELFRLICEEAWDNAEPGVLFWDRITGYNLMQYDPNFHLDGVNPCVSGDTLLLTSDGYFPIKSLVGKEVKVWNGKKFTKSTPRITGYDQPMLRIRLSIGTEIECTTYHSFILPNNDRIEACKLQEGMILGKPESFPEMDGIENPYKDLKEDEYPSILSIEKIENAEVVYCLTEEDNHSVIFNGIYTGQCAEQALTGYGACLLGSLNLSAFVKSDKTFDFEDFRCAVFTAVHALNQVLDEGIESHPLKQQSEAADYWRPIGLGIMGLGDMLIKMEIVYGSKESLEICDKIGKTLAMSAISQSIEEAETHSEFNGCDRGAIIASDFFKNNAHQYDGVKVLESGIRNCQLLTAPPTGSTATMLNISTGIEPIFDRYYERKTETLNDEEKIYKVYTQIVWDYMQEHGISEDDDDQLPEWFITAKEIPYQDRIRMQATWQKHIDVSISSTVNLPESTNVEDVMNLYMMAWEEGLKGVTIFREGCKRAPILNSTKKKEKPEVDIAKYEREGSTIKSFYDDIFKKTAAEHAKTMMNVSKEDHTLERGEVIKAPANSIGKNRDLVTGCGSLHFQAFFDINTGDVVMTYLSKGSEGGCNSFMVGLSRMISMAGRAGVNIYEIADQLHSVPGCTSYIGRKREKKDVSKGTCCPTAIGYALIEMYEEVQEEIALGGVYKGSPLYYKLKAQKELSKSYILYDDIAKLYEKAKVELDIQPQITELAGQLRSIPGVSDIFKNMSDGQIMTAMDRILNTNYDQMKRIMSCDTCEKECEVHSNELIAPREEPKTHEEMERLVAEKTGKCPNCGEHLVYEGGCIDCKACGWSQCD